MFFLSGERHSRWRAVKARSDPVNVSALERAGNHIVSEPEPEQFASGVIVIKGHEESHDVLDAKAHCLVPHHPPQKSTSSTRIHLAG
ncbi:hypothetical protein GOEFS_091_00290 [Gordonia effusa NBRC 100432]|uniref:Uncharacterized protein n=1 Tax=Gordonia effusa NBRC 100432 TaxID=1077974 RepID=H0R386_9ACTN|nr:hypothetical protein GOEFS_091_00290 [Gordonia effusa NBRC 100432]